MKLQYWVIALGLYMLLMGIIGYVRTSSPTAIFINGSFAVATILIGYFWGRNLNPTLGTITLVWTSLITVLMAYMTFKRIAAHEQARAGSEFIFGSMAIFALIVTIVLWRNRAAG